MSSRGSSRRGILASIDRSTAAILVLMLVVGAFAIYVILRVPTGAERGTGGQPVSHYTPPADPAAAKPIDPTATLPAPGHRLDVLVAGDSISQGRFATKAPNGYVERLTRALDKKWDADVTVIGDSGYQSFQVTPLVPQRAFDLVVVELGTNDSTNSPPEKFPRRYDTLLDKIRQQSPHAGLLCAGSWQTAYRASLVDYAIENSCDQHHGLYVRLADLYLNDKLRGPDGAKGVYGVGDNFHPNDAGHRAIFERLAKPLGLAD